MAVPFDVGDSFLCSSVTAMPNPSARSSGHILDRSGKKPGLQMSAPPGRALMVTILGVVNTEMDPPLTEEILEQITETQMMRMGWVPHGIVQDILGYIADIEKVFTAHDLKMPEPPACLGKCPPSEASPD